MDKTQTKPAKTPGLRMKQLMDATGLPKSTLLYYVDQGLLPRPHKTSPNMAYYDPDCVRRAAVIRQLQTQHRLPLAKIRQVLEAMDRGEDPTPLLELALEVFGRDEGEKLGMADFCRSTGLSRQRVNELLKYQLLLPLEEGRFDQQDVAMGALYARGQSMGMEPARAEFYPRLGKKIVDHEMRLRQRMTGDLPPEEDAQATLNLVRAARATRAYVIDRLFQLRIASSTHLKDEKLLGVEGENEQDS